MKKNTGSVGHVKQWAAWVHRTVVASAAEISLLPPFRQRRWQQLPTRPTQSGLHASNTQLVPQHSSVVNIYTSLLHLCKFSAAIVCVCELTLFYQYLKIKTRPSWRLVRHVSLRFNWKHLGRMANTGTRTKWIKGEQEYWISFKSAVGVCCEHCRQRERFNLSRLSNCIPTSRHFSTTTLIWWQASDWSRQQPTKRRPRYR